MLLRSTTVAMAPFGPSSIRISAISVTRVISSPILSGSWNATRVPPIRRRGKGIGGTMPPPEA